MIWGSFSGANLLVRFRECIELLHTKNMSVGLQTVVVELVELTKVEPCFLACPAEASDLATLHGTNISMLTANPTKTLAPII